MKQAICYCILFLGMVYQASAQKNIFFKKDKSKYAFVSKKAEQHKKEQQQLPSHISLYATSLVVKGSFSLYVPRTYESTDSRDALLFILGLGGSILGSIYADKHHYQYYYTGESRYPSPDNWRHIH